MSLFTLPFISKFSHKINHYDINLTLSPPSHSLRCNVALTITSDEHSSEFSFLLADFCRLENISYLGLPLKFSLRQISGQQKLIKLKLPRKADAGEKLTIIFAYTGRLGSDCERPGSICPELCELAPGSKWYPYLPGLQKYTAEISVILPEPMRLVANGSLTEEKRLDTRYQVHWSSKVAHQGLHIVAGKFNKTAREGLSVYYPRSKMNQAKSIANYGEKITEYLVQWLGRHPGGDGTIMITETDEPKAYVSFNINTISTGLITQETDDQNPKEKRVRLFRLTARELAHRWLIASLPHNKPGHAWYLLALAEYISWVLLEQEFDIKTRNLEMQAAKEAAQSAQSIQSVAKRYPTLPDWVTAKGSWLMRIIHCKLGDSFFPLIQEIFIEHNGTAPKPLLFFTELGKKAGIPLEKIYQEWVVSAQKLILEIESPRNFTDEANQWQLVFSLVNNGKLRWEDPIDIKLTMADGTTELRSYPISADPHLISTTSKIISIEVDPHRKLLNWAAETKYLV